MKVLAVLQILAFLAISVDAMSYCISTKEKKNGFCQKDPDFKLADITEINFKIDETLSLCISTKDFINKDCTDFKTAVKLEDITQIKFSNQDISEEKNVKK